WKVLEALKWCTDYLEAHDDPNPRLSAQWLLSGVTGLSRVEVYAYHDRLLDSTERAQLREWLKRRADGEPLQYILGEASFRDLVLTVTPAVLIPRPETEGLVQLVINYLKGKGLGSNFSDTAEEIERDPLAQQASSFVSGAETTGSVERIDVGKENSLSSRLPMVLDIGTGSGAIVLSLAQECPDLNLTATDISPEALEVARQNAQRLGLDERIDFIESDWYAALDDRTFDLIVSNPPYIPTSAMATLEKQVREYEPPGSLDGGEDGLDIYRRILEGSVEHLAENGALFVELDEGNTTQACDLAVQLERYSQVVIEPDLNGRDRYVIVGSSRD
ncbi:MAG: peptide chain release factor N(5)-glutamine methyltransferase, partial [Actinomycetia bacterium]|nr:peptide chain release factor N(5)-glutamine methyltransferase [Actinomycetes bacterium]